MADPTLTIRIVEEGGKQQLVASGPLSPEEQAQLQELGLPVTSPEGKTRRQKAGHESPQEREERREREHNLAVDRRKAERDSRQAERDQVKATRESKKLRQDEQSIVSKDISRLTREFDAGRRRSRARKHRIKRAGISRIRNRRAKIGSWVGSAVSAAVTQSTGSPLAGTVAGGLAARSAAAGGALGLAAGAVAGAGLAAVGTFSALSGVVNQGVQSVSGLSGDVIAAQAITQVRLLEQILERANTIGTKLGDYAASQGKLAVEVERFKTNIMGLAAPGLTKFNDFITAALRWLNNQLDDQVAADEQNAWLKMMNDTLNMLSDPNLLRNAPAAPIVPALVAAGPNF